MNQPENHFSKPEETPPMEISHRRRRKRSVLADSAGEQAAVLEELGHNFYPSIDFWFYSFLSGLVIGIAALSNSLPLFILAAVIAPFLSPILGLAFATVTGSIRYFLQVLGGVIIGLLLVFMGSALVGWVSQSWQSNNLDNSLEISQFSWIGLGVVFVGAILTTMLVVRSENKKAFGSSVLLAYLIYLPLGISGFGLSVISSGLWPQGFYLSLMYLTWTIVIAVFTFGASGLGPKSLTSYFLGAALLIAGAAGLLAYYMAPSTSETNPVIKITSTSLVQAQPVQEATSAPTTRNEPSITPSATGTPAPTKTSTQTLTMQPTSVFAIINSEGNGAIVRLEPDLNAPSTLPPLMDGTEVKVLSDTFEKGNITWIRIRTIEGYEGWILKDLLATETPVPE